MPARSIEIERVEVQRWRVVREFEQLATAREGRRLVEEIDDGNCSQHATPAVRARGDCRGFEIVGELEQFRGFIRVELNFVAVVVEQ